MIHQYHNFSVLYLTPWNDPGIKSLTSIYRVVDGRTKLLPIAIDSLKVAATEAVLAERFYVLRRIRAKLSACDVRVL